MLHPIVFIFYLSQRYYMGCRIFDLCGEINIHILIEMLKYSLLESECGRCGKAWQILILKWFGHLEKVRTRKQMTLV